MTPINPAIKSISFILCTSSKIFRDIDSDYSGDDTELPIKENPPPQSLGTLDGNSLSSVSSQNIFLQGSNQSGLQATQAAAQKRQLAVINEIDDRKDGKKKSANAPNTKKKSK